MAKYHETAYQKAYEKPYFWASLNANGYDERFDLAGNALAILLGFDLNLEGFSSFLEKLSVEFNHWDASRFFIRLSFQKMLTGIYWKIITVMISKTSPINFTMAVLGQSILAGFVWD